jgi:hypothetical protein
MQGEPVKSCVLLYSYAKGTFSFSLHFLLTNYQNTLAFGGGTLGNSSSREWQPPEWTSDELNELVKLALFIYESYPPHKHRKEYNIDFTSILLVFLYARNDVSDWFRSYVRQANIKIKDIHTYKDLNSATLEGQIENFVYF